MELFRASSPKHFGVQAAVRVVLHKNLTGLRQAFAAGHSTQRAAQRTLAFFSPWPDSLRLLGEIHLARTCCPLDVVAHEVTHAGAEWLRRDKRRVVALAECVSEDEERLAYLCGGLVARIVKELRKRGMEL